MNLAEEPGGRRARIRKELASFYVKEAGPYVLAWIFATVLAIYCFRTIFSAVASQAERDWSKQVVTLILTAILGAAFGRSTK